MGQQPATNNHMQPSLTLLARAEQMIQRRLGRSPILDECSVMELEQLLQASEAYSNEQLGRTLNDMLDKARVQRLLDYSRAHPEDVWRRPAYWAAVILEARALGMIPPEPARVGCNCKPGIDRGIVYGGDREDIF